ncbi:cytochrome c-type biogenesis protein CcmH [Sutterella massiliensis]|uniref:Cytochrome c-type biogenesis protein n=1 Tax=Sutterella massiliensis TaxID=1816689 RepID=A0ABS2DVF7_9BURK|nr:cytochrome c-type biogenesis protein CcmH [Sutterella massiliensis]
MTLSRTKLAFAGIAAALSLAMTPALHAKEAAPTAFDPIAHKRVVEVSEQLRCLVCQNQSIADSNAELAVDLRNQVIEQVKAGKTNKEIVDYMVERYGDFVLYKPPFKLSTAILWLGPLCLFVAGLGAFYINLRRRKRMVAEAAKPLSAQDKALADELLSGRKE